MTKHAPKALARLVALSGLIREVKLADLDEALRARDDNLAKLAAMNVQMDAPDLTPVAAGRAALRYQCWAEERRAELNISIAGQNVRIEELREAAKRAFGRDEALKALRSRRR